jgi:hypothetical protein
METRDNTRYYASAGNWMTFECADPPGEKAAAFNSIDQQVLSNTRIPMDNRRRLYQAIVVNIALWGSESWTLKEKDRTKLETFHNSCLRRMCNLTMWDIAEKWITNEEVRRTAAISSTMESMMEVRRFRLMALQTQRNGKVKIFKANAWRMVLNATTTRETAADHTTCSHNHSREPCFWT